MAKQTKYYVVWQGHKTGIFNDWADCQQAVKGFKDAKFKSFATKQEAEQALKNPDSIKSTDKKKYFYVVWYGFKPGIYDNWNEAQLAINGYKNPYYKTFGSRKLAEQAFREGPENFRDGDFKKTKDLDEESLKKIGKPLELSLSVDAACNGKGDMEYRGVWTATKDEIFKLGPLKKGSNNIGEFLALVHALAYLNKSRDTKLHTMPIYSDSKIAMSWVKQKICKTNKKPSEEVQNLINRAEFWLKNNSYKNKILKWETKVWGEIPADFGRK